MSPRIQCCHPVAPPAGMPERHCPYCLLQGIILIPGSSSAFVLRGQLQLLQLCPKLIPSTAARGETEPQASHDSSRKRKSRKGCGFLPSVPLEPKPVSIIYSKLIHNYISYSWPVRPLLSLLKISFLTHTIKKRPPKTPITSTFTKHII